VAFQQSNGYARKQIVMSCFGAERVWQIEFQLAAIVNLLEKSYVCESKLLQKRDHCKNSLVLVVCNIVFTPAIHASL